MNFPRRLGGEGGGGARPRLAGEEIRTRQRHIYFGITRITVHSNSIDGLNPRLVIKQDSRRIECTVTAIRNPITDAGSAA
jgi:hypothetical protein